MWLFFGRAGLKRCGSSKISESRFAETKYNCITSPSRIFVPANSRSRVATRTMFMAGVM
ncbi:hypothetical protein D3C86_2161270 [compost metagenome]